MLVNGAQFPDPQTYRIEPPNVLNTSLSGEPAVAWDCSIRLQFSLTTDGLYVYRRWIELLGQRVQFTLPSLCGGTLTGYVSSVAPDVGLNGEVRGCDVTIVSVPWEQVIGGL